MSEYYKVDSRRVTLREYWNILPSWKSLLPWVAGRFNIRVPLGPGFPRTPPVQEMEIGEVDFLPLAKEKLQPDLERCLQTGFHSPRFYTFSSIRGDTRTWIIGLMHRSGEVSVRLMFSRSDNGATAVENLLTALVTELADGTTLCSSNQKPKFNNRPGLLINRLVGATPEQLLESHQQKLSALAQRNPPRVIRTKDELDDLWDRHEQAALEYGFQRGLYVRMSAEEVEVEKGMQQAAQAFSSQGMAHPDVLVEINRLQNKKGGWGSAILIFVVSMLLFVGVGAQQWSWKYALMLVPILFFHELGHYVAMRLFAYRNLRMFFLPFFGAAVSGRHYNVPGWKKVLVFMMGPLPGIVLGAALGGLGLILHQPLLTQVAMVTLILNGLNLLPVLPLDGGWIVHALFFCRHPLLDVTFRLLAVAALAVGGFYSRDKILMYLSIPMLLGLPMTYRMARITAALRRRGVATGSPDDQTIPVETAQAIIEELKAALPKAQTTKMVAQQTLKIFENLNAKPPGWLATMALVAVHGISLGLAVIFAAVCAVGQRGDLSSLLQKSAQELEPLKLALPCQASLIWRGAQSSGLADGAVTTIIANMPKAVDAEGLFRSWTNEVPAKATLKVLGNSLMMALPAEEAQNRKRLFDELQRRTKAVFVDRTNYPARLSVSWQMAEPRQAEAVEQELEEYLSAVTPQSLIPPWSPDDRRSAEERMAHRLARSTYLKTQAGRWTSFSDPRMRAIQKNIIEAQRQGDDERVAALRKQTVDLSTKLEAERLERIKTSSDGPVDNAVIDLAMQLSAGELGTNRMATRALVQELAARMGQLPMNERQVKPGEARFSARHGAVLRKERTMLLRWLTFCSISDGAPALIDWLCARGATDLHYDLKASTTATEEDDELEAE